MGEIYELKVKFKKISDVTKAILNIGRSKHRFDSFSRRLANSMTLLDECEESEIIDLLSSIPVSGFDYLEFEPRNHNPDVDFGAQEGRASFDRADSEIGDVIDEDSDDKLSDLALAVIAHGELQKGFDWSYPDFDITGASWFWFGALSGASFVAQDLSKWFPQDNPINVLSAYLDDNYLKIAEDDVWGSLARKIRVFVYSSSRVSNDLSLSQVSNISKISEDYQLHKDKLVCLIDEKFPDWSKGHGFEREHVADFELAIILDQILRVFDDDHSLFIEKILDRDQCENCDIFASEKRLIEFVTALASGDGLSECHWPQIANIYIALISFKSFDVDSYGGEAVRFGWMSILENDYPSFVKEYLEAISEFMHFWERFFFTNLNEKRLCKLPLASVPALGLVEYNHKFFKDDSLVGQRISDVEFSYAVVMSVLCPKRHVTEASLLESLLVLSRAGYGISVISILSLYLVCKGYPNLRAIDEFRFGVYNADRYSPELLRFVNAIVCQVGVRSRRQLSHAVSVFAGLDDVYQGQVYSFYDEFLPERSNERDLFTVLMEEGGGEISSEFSERLIELRKYWHGETPGDRLSFVLGCSSLMESILYGMAKHFASQLDLTGLDSGNANKIRSILNGKSSLGMLWNFVSNDGAWKGLNNKNVLQALKEVRRNSDFLSSDRIKYSMNALADIRNKVAHMAKADAVDAVAFYYHLRHENLLEKLLELAAKPN